MEERKGGYEGSETVSPILPILLHESLHCNHQKDGGRTRVNTGPLTLTCYFKKILHGIQYCSPCRRRLSRTSMDSLICFRPNFTIIKKITERISKMKKQKKMDERERLLIRTKRSENLGVFL